MSTISYHASSSKRQEGEAPYTFANGSISDDEDEEPEELNLDLTARETMLTGMLKSPVTGMNPFSCINKLQCLPSETSGTLRAIDLHRKFACQCVSVN